MQKSQEEKLLVLAVVGMPATGKSEVLKTLVSKYNFYHLYYGGITIDEVKRRGLEVNEVNEKFVREDMRKSGDMGIYSRFMIPKIEEAIKNGYKRILLESMYNIWEYELIKEKYGESFKVLAIHSDFDIRLKRIGSRADRKLNLDELNSRQISEAKNLGKGTVISLADYNYVNNGDMMEVFENELDIFIQQRILGTEIKVKNFDKWNGIKKLLDKKVFSQAFPKKAEVWFANLGKNIGYEEDGTGYMYERPVLVLKKINNQMYIVVPLSSKQKEFDFYYNYSDHEGKNVAAILAQVKLISINRFDRKISDFNLEEFYKLKQRFLSMF